MAHTFDSDVINLRTVMGRRNGMGSTAQTAAQVSTAATVASSSTVAIAQGGLNPIADITAAASIFSLISSIGSSPGKQRYLTVYYPNAQSFVTQFGRDFVAGAAATNGAVSASAIAQSLSDKLAEVGTGPGVTLSPAQLIADAHPTPVATAASTAGNIASSVVSAVTSGGVGTYVAIGGAALLLLLLLKK